MKTIVFISATMLAALLSLALYIYSLDGAIQRCDRSLSALAALKMADTDIESDVLKTRIGALRDYRGLFAGDRRARDALERLRRLARADAELGARIVRLAGDYEAKQIQLARFRVQNALLSDAMRTFSAESGRQLAAERDVRAVRAIGALTGSVHRLCQDDSVDALREVHQRFDAMAQAGGAGPLLVHARELAQLLPQTHATILKLQPLPHLPSYAAVQTYLAQHRESLAERSLQARSGLILLAIAMLATLVYLAKMLHERARALRRRSEFDRLMMAISRDLLGCERARTDAVVAASLARLSQSLGNVETGLVLSCGQARPRSWSGAEDPAFAAFAHALIAGAPPGAGPGHDAFVVDERGRSVELRAGDRAPLRRARWLCLRRRSESGATALLCCTRPRQRASAAAYSEFVLLRSALDTLADALERQRLEDEARVLEHRLGRARDMETIGTMASGISHNFNNIIGAIRGNVETAQLRLAPHAHAQANLAEIGRALEHAAELVEAILSFGRTQNHHVRPVEINELAKRSRSLLVAALPASVEFELRPAPSALQVWGNPSQLQQVILNLGTNAAQAMSMRGPILIQVTRIDGDSAPERVRIEVIDRGVGIPAPQLDRIFDPFFTTRKGGTGLGLATVKQIVGNHNGRIQVDSRPGLGTRFVVDLPLCEGDCAAGDGHETWLVLCADPAARERLEDLLAALGHEPIGYADADHAAHAIAERTDHFDGALVQSEDARCAAGEVATLHALLPGRPILLALHNPGLTPAPDLGYAVAEILRAPVRAESLARALARSSQDYGYRPGALHM